MSPRETNSKITPEHLSRHAVVYLRQSSLAQVKQNTESRRLQYALTETARAYGFQRVQVIDRDLGMSAARGAPAREGFKQLPVRLRGSPQWTGREPRSLPPAPSRRSATRTR